MSLQIKNLYVLINFIIFPYFWYSNYNLSRKSMFQKLFLKSVILTELGNKKGSFSDITAILIIWDRYEVF